MKWYCVAEPSKYCDGTPEWEKEPQAILEAGTNEIKFYSGGICKLTPETCGRCKTSQQLFDELSEEEKERVSHPGYIQNITPIKKSDAEGKKPKSKKSKKAQKLEAEIAQRSMFQ